MNTIVDNQEVTLKKKIGVFYKDHVMSYDEQPCPIKNILADSLDKWSLFIMYNLGYFGVLRFNQLKNRIDGISSRMLSSTLKKLEANHIVIRTVYAEVPPRVEYQLSDFGEKLTYRVIDLSQWYLQEYPKVAGVKHEPK